MLRALIFDFDGLIVDTESSSLATVQEAYRRRGHNLRSEHWRQCVSARTSTSRPRWTGWGSVRRRR